VNKTGGSGNAATIVGTLEATSIVRTGGTSSQFLKADGSVDNNTYATTSALSGYLPLSGGTLTGNLLTSAGRGIVIGGSSFAFAPSSTRGSMHIAGSTDRILSLGTNGSNSVYIYSSSAVSQFNSTPDIDLIAAGSSRLFINASTGTTTLSGALNGTSAAFSGATQLATSSGRVLIKTTTDNGTDALQVAGSGLFTGGVNMATSSGNVGIGITTPNSNADKTLHLHNANTSSSYFKVTNSTTGAGINDGLDFGEINSNTYVINRENGFMSFWTNDTERLKIEATGAATFSSSVTATGFIVSSSKTLKDVYSRSKQDDGIDFVGYTWKKKLNLDSKKHLGFIAEEVEKVLPDAVFANDKGVKSVNYTEVLIYKLSQLTDRVEQLEKQLSKYKKRNK
jgi:hypothetical protein